LDGGWGRGIAGGKYRDSRRGRCKWTIAARCRTADNSFSGALHPPVKGQRRKATREQPVGGREMRMEREPKKKNRREKVEKNTTKLERKN